MTRIQEILEPGETIRLIHWPNWFVYAVVAFLAVSDVLVVTAMLLLLGGDALEPEILYTVIVLFLAASGLVLLVSVRLLRIAVVTDRRVMHRSGLGWAHPIELRLPEIESVEQRRGMVIVAGAGREISFPCPPAMAARILNALEER